MGAKLRGQDSQSHERTSSRTGKTEQTPLRKYLRIVQQRSNDGFILAADDIIEALKLDVFGGCKVYCVCRDPSGRLHPSLSIFWSGQTAIHFSSTADVELYLNEANLPRKAKGRHLAKGPYNWYSIHSPDISHPYADQILRDLLKICELVRQASLNIQNLRFREVHNDVLLFQTLVNETKIRSVEDTCSYIRRRWNIHASSASILPNVVIEANNCFPAEALTLDRRVLTSVATQLVAEPAYSRMLVELHEKGCPVAGTLLHKGKRYSFLIYPLAQRIRQPAVVRRHIVLWSSHGIKQTTAAAVLDCIDFFVTYSTVGGKARSIIELDGYIISAALSNKAEGRKELEARFKEVCKTALFGVIATTQAHSAVLRMYNPASRELEVFWEESAKWGRRDMAPRLHGIPVEEYRVSLNAFTFAMATRDHSFFYLADVKFIPDELAAKGLERVLVARARSRSEACYCLFCGRVPFAVLNVEAEGVDAFQYDNSYFLAVKNALERFFELNSKSRDTRWLAEGSSVYQRGHEAENLLATDLFNDEQRAMLSPYLLPRPLAQTGTRRELVQIRELIDSWIGGLRAPSVSRKARRILQLRVSSSAPVPMVWLEKIFLIIQNLLINAVNYGRSLGPSRDSLVVEEEPAIEVVAERYLSITLDTAGRFSEDVRDILTIAPIPGERRYRYGMFLVGVWARSMGGLVQVVTREARTVISVRVPIDRG